MSSDRKQNDFKPLTVKSSPKRIMGVYNSQVFQSKRSNQEQDEFLSQDYEHLPPLKHKKSAVTRKSVNNISNLYLKKNWVPSKYLKPLQNNLSKTKNSGS